MNTVKEFVEKTIDRLEEEKEKGIYDSDSVISVKDAWRKSIKIVNQMAEEYVPDINIGNMNGKARQIADDLSAVLKEAKSMGCKEVKYFHHIPLENVEIVVNALRAYNQGWIPCSERLPEDDGDYLVTRLGGNGIEVDISEYEHGYMYNNGFHKAFQVIAWQPLPEPYKPEPQKEIPTKHYEERFNRVV